MKLSFSFSFDRNVLIQSDVIQLENELIIIRERYNELAEYSTTLKYELDNARKQLHERSLIERDTVGAGEEFFLSY